MKGFSFGIVLLVLSALTPAHAALCQQHNNRVVFTGLGNLNATSATDRLFAEVVRGRGRSNAPHCGCQVVRFYSNLSSPRVRNDLQLVLSVLLTAQVTGKEVRIDLAQAGNCDSAYRVYLYDAANSAVGHAPPPETLFGD